MRTIVVNGVPFSYVQAGHGPPVIFVHGSLEDYRSWRRQMEPFAGRYHVVAYSRRYHHPNPEPVGGPEYSVDTHARDLLGFIEALHLAPVHLVCSSFGGLVGLYLAARRPDVIRTIVVAEPPIIPWLYRTPEGAPLSRAFGADAWLPAGQAFQRGDDIEGVRLFMNGVIGEGVFERMSKTSRVMPLDNARALRAEALAENYFSPFTCADAGRINRPALVLQGERSPQMFHMICDELAQCLPLAERARIPGASHAMHIENPTFYNQTVLAFLERSGQG